MTFPLLGVRVKFKTKYGAILFGKIKEEVDWLVGCPVFVDDASGDIYGVGYDGEVVGVLNGKV